MLTLSPVTVYVSPGRLSQLSLVAATTHTTGVFDGVGSSTSRDTTKMFGK